MTITSQDLRELVKGNPTALASLERQLGGGCVGGVIHLPYPPSVNRYYRSVGGRAIISAEGREYRERVVSILGSMQIRPILDRIALEVRAVAPDKRRRDLDNLSKALLDALQHGGLFEDDAQIADERLLWWPPVPDLTPLVVQVGA